MATFQIKGGKPLKGEITPQGAKNEVLQILCAVLLTNEQVRVKNKKSAPLLFLLNDSITES